MKYPIRHSQLCGAVVFVVAGLVFTPLAVGQDSFPEAPARDTLIVACTQCHSLGRMAIATLTAEDWQFVVYDMIARGAPVRQEDIADLTTYLQDNFATDKQ